MVDGEKGEKERGNVHLLAKHCLAAAALAENKQATFLSQGAYLGAGVDKQTNKKTPLHAGRAKRREGVGEEGALVWAALAREASGATTCEPRHPC